MIIIDILLSIAIFIFFLGILGIRQANREAGRSPGTSGALGLFLISLIICACSGGIGLLFGVIRIFLTNGW